MLTIVSFLLVFSLIVLIHELGHFLAARWHGIFVKEFSIGMGPRLWSYQGSQTLYSLKAFPIGGSVQMEGEQEAVEAENSFSTKKAWQRFTVIVAGPLMNFVLALVLLFGVYFYQGTQTTTIEALIPDMPAISSGLTMGDTITEIDGQTIKSWNDIVTAIDTAKNPTIEIKVRRLEETLSFRVPVQEDQETQRKMVGIRPRIERSLGNAFKGAFTVTGQLSVAIVEFIPRLISGKESMDNVAGPVGLAVVIGQQASLGIVNLLHFTAFISVNLGIMNLLPFPALDGGRLVFIGYEMIFRRRANQRFEEGLHYIGFMLLMLLMVMVVISDFGRFF